MDTLKDLLTALAINRQQAEQLRIKRSKLDEEIEQSFLGRELERTSQSLNDTTLKMAELEATIKSQAYLEWSQLENKEEVKHPWPGIDVKHFDIVKIIDEKKALAWAVQNMPSALKLNVSTLEKGVKALELDFIEKTDEYKVQIASNLGGYLDDKDTAS